MAKWSFKQVKSLKTIIVKPDQKRLWHQCERLEYEVFLDCGYISASAEKRIKHFDRYKRMEFIAAISDSSQGFLHEERLMGVLRIVYPSIDESQPITGMFPTLRNAKQLDYSSQATSKNYLVEVPYENNDILWLFSDRYDQILKFNPSHCIDLATIAISLRGQKMKAIYAINARTATRVWEQPPLRYCLIAVDYEVCSRYKAKGLPICELGPRTLYWGSPTVPILIDLHKVPIGIQKIIILLYRLKGYLGIK